MQHNNLDASINSIYILTGTLTTCSPLIMGAGSSDETDKIIMKDKDGKPYIPSTAITGCLKHYFYEHYVWQPLSTQIDKAGNRQPGSLDFFWGTDDTNQKETSQAHFIISDLRIDKHVNQKVEILDGVKIAQDTGIAVDGAKYDYEAINQDASFSFNAKLIIRAAFEVAEMEQILSTVSDILTQQDDFRIGAYTSHGFGQIKADLKIYHYDFVNSKDDAIKWFKYRANGVDTITKSNLTLKPLGRNTNRDFKITADFKIKSSLISGVYSGEFKTESNQDIPDKTSYKYGKQPALTGKAIKGAINHRIHKIVNTIVGEVLGENHPKKLEVYKLLGFVSTEGKVLNPKEEPVKAQISRLKTEFAVIKDVKPQLQDRIKIDRFTGGTIDGAKFDSEPLWRQGDDPNVTLTFTIKDYKDWEPGLMLQILKDLYCEDLPIGGEKNVGRGILQGVNATITVKDKVFKISGTKEVNVSGIYIYTKIPIIQEQAIKDLNEYADIFYKHFNNLTMSAYKIENKNSEVSQFTLGEIIYDNSEQDRILKEKLIDKLSVIKNGDVFCWLNNDLKRGLFNNGIFEWKIVKEEDKKFSLEMWRIIELRVFNTDAELLLKNSNGVLNGRIRTELEPGIETDYVDADIFLATNDNIKINAGDKLTIRNYITYNTPTGQASYCDARFLVIE